MPASTAVWYYLLITKVILIPQSVLQQVHSFFQSESSRVWPCASSCNFQYLPISLTSSSSCLHLICLSVTSIPPPIFPSITCFTRQFLCKMCSIQLVCLLCTAHRIFFSSFALCETSFLTWLVQLIFSSTTFQKLSNISDLLSEASKFQHHTKLCSSCSNLLAASLNISPICWWKEECCFCHEIHNPIQWIKKKFPHLLSKSNFPTNIWMKQH